MFSILEKDTKTFNYFKHYTDCLNQGKSFLEIDNAIQAKELLNHLAMNGLTENDTEAKLAWIAENGQAFREYLNSIKLIYVICKVSQKDPSQLTPAEFAMIEEKINQQQHCLSTMYT